MQDMVSVLVHTQQWTDEHVGGVVLTASPVHLQAGGVRLSLPSHDAFKYHVAFKYSKTGQA